MLPEPVLGAPAVVFPCSISAAQVSARHPAPRSCVRDAGTWARDPVSWNLPPRAAPCCWKWGSLGLGPLSHPQQCPGSATLATLYGKTGPRCNLKPSSCFVVTNRWRPIGCDHILVQRLSSGFLTCTWVF